MYWGERSLIRRGGLLPILFFVAVSLTACSLSSNSVSSGNGGNNQGGSGGAHRVSLSWKASTSNNVVAYNIYRGTNAGTFSLLNSMNAGDLIDNVTLAYANLLELALASGNRVGDINCGAPPCLLS
jgi:hypothetical protein